MGIHVRLPPEMNNFDDPLMFGPCTSTRLISSISFNALVYDKKKASKLQKMNKWNGGERLYNNVQKEHMLEINSEKATR